MSCRNTRRARIWPIIAKTRSDQKRVEPNPEKHPAAQQVEIGAMKAAHEARDLRGAYRDRCEHSAGDVRAGHERDDEPEKEPAGFQMLGPSAGEMPQPKLSSCRPPAGGSSSPTTKRMNLAQCRRDEHLVLDKGRLRARNPDGTARARPPALFRRARVSVVRRSLHASGEKK